MDIDKQRKTAAILRALQQAAKPIGSAAISERLISLGFNLRERMVRYYLALTDEQDLTENLGRRGHVITDRGRRELEVAVAIDKVGFVNSRIDELAYTMKFDEDALAGTVIMNHSLIRTSRPQRMIEILTRILQANLGMGQYVRIRHLDRTLSESSSAEPQYRIALGTICGVTLNGILLRHGISMTNRFGGLLELQEGVPVRFSQIIYYDGSTIDPLEIFIKSGMTSVVRAAETGTGSIGASFREIPVAALDDARRLIRKLEAVGLGGVLLVGRPNQPLLDIPVSTGHAGLIVAGGLNPVAALEESRLATENRSLHGLSDFSELQRIDTIPPWYMQSLPQEPDQPA